VLQIQAGKLVFLTTFMSPGRRKIKHAEPVEVYGFSPSRTFQQPLNKFRMQFNVLLNFFLFCSALSDVVTLADNRKGIILMMLIFTGPKGQASVSRLLQFPG
jgi:hypothetical protein